MIKKCTVGENKMEIRIAVVDDSEADRNRMIAELRRYFYMISDHQLILYSFRSSEEFISDEAYRSFHAVFLDIFMDGMTGIELGKKLRADNPILAIVFVTSSPDMYASAAPLGMFDYLQKPFEAERLNLLLDRMLAYLPMVSKRNDQIVSIRIPRGKVHISLSDIICVLSNNHTTEVYAANREMIQSNMKYSELAELLKTDTRFLECNRGVTVNMEHIVSMTDKVYVSNGLELPIKVRERAKLLSIFSDFSIHRMTEF